MGRNESEVIYIDDTDEEEEKRRVQEALDEPRRIRREYIFRDRSADTPSPPLPPARRSLSTSSTVRHPVTGEESSLLPSPDHSAIPASTSPGTMMTARQASAEKKRAEKKRAGRRGMTAIVVSKPSAERHASSASTAARDGKPRNIRPLFEQHKIWVHQLDGSLGWLQGSWPAATYCPPLVDSSDDFESPSPPSRVVSAAGAHTGARSIAKRLFEECSDGNDTEVLSEADNSEEEKKDSAPNGDGLEGNGVTSDDNAAMKRHPAASAALRRSRLAQVLNVWMAESKRSSLKDDGSEEKGAVATHDNSEAKPADDDADEKCATPPDDGSEEKRAAPKDDGSRQQRAVPRRKSMSVTIDKDFGEWQGLREALQEKAKRVVPADDDLEEKRAAPKDDGAKEKRAAPRRKSMSITIDKDFAEWQGLRKALQEKAKRVVPADDDLEVKATVSADSSSEEKHAVPTDNGSVSHDDGSEEKHAVPTDNGSVSPDGDSEEKQALPVSYRATNKRVRPEDASSNNKRTRPLRDGLSPSSQVLQQVQRAPRNIVDVIREQLGVPLSAQAIANLRRGSGPPPNHHDADANETRRRDSAPVSGVAAEEEAPSVKDDSYHVVAHGSDEPTRGDPPPVEDGVSSVMTTTASRAASVVSAADTPAVTGDRAIERRARAAEHRSLSWGQLPGVAALPVFMPALWPSEVIHIRASYNPLDLTFPNYGHFGLCDCLTPCRHHTCMNGRLSLFCDEDCCSHGGRCGNGLNGVDTLRLADCPRGNGLAVVATSPIDEGVIIGEFLGELTLGLSENNAGYRLELTERSQQSSRHRVAVDTLRYGSILRFMNHSCEANCEFVEVSNGFRHTAVAVTRRPILAEEEVTGYYGTQLWFICNCSSRDCLHRDYHGEQ